VDGNGILVEEEKTVYFDGRRLEQVGMDGAWDDTSFLTVFFMLETVYD